MLKILDSGFILKVEKIEKIEKIDRITNLVGVLEVLDIYVENLGLWDYFED